MDGSISFEAYFMWYSLWTMTEQPTDPNSVKATLQDRLNAFLHPSDAPIDPGDLILGVGKDEIEIVYQTVAKAVQVARDFVSNQFPRP